jgi:hypothetical protein
VSIDIIEIMPRKQGYKVLEKTKIKISEKQKGQHHSVSTEFKKGHKSFNHWLGKKHKEITKEKISLAHKGKKLSEKTREKISEALKGRKPKNHVWGRKGEENPLWIKDRSLIKRQIERNNTRYKEWRNRIFIRDKYKCRIDNHDCNGKIIAHHILSWKDFPELRYNINNGITLCQAHHPKRRAEEKQLIPFFNGLVVKSNELICQKSQIHGQ